MSRFGAQLRAAHARNMDRVDEISKKIMIDLDQKVVLKTPVDTGRARGNWIPSTGAPILEASITEDKSGNLSISASIQVHAASGKFAPMFLTNNLPYIEALENGSSNQAPSGMAKLSVQEVARQFK